jgi:oligopeptide transport system substrate-binding protein
MRPVAALLATVVLLSACSAGRDAADESITVPSEDADVGVDVAPERGTLRVGIGRDPQSIDPRLVTDAEGEWIARALFEPLVDVGPDGALVPAAAERWDVEDDGRTYRFHLRPARFHDGRRVTAFDHARALLGVFDETRPPYFREELLAGLLGAQVAQEPLDEEAAADEQQADAEEGPGASTRWATPQEITAAGGVIVVSELELVVRLAAADPRFLATLSDVALMPVPFSALGNAEGFAALPIGNGPFRMLEAREAGTFVRLVAVDDHHRRPQVDGIVFQVFAADRDRSARLEALLAGRLHVAAVAPERRELVTREFGLAGPDSRGPGLHTSTTASVYTYAFNVAAPPFDDVRLRRAIAAAIDRERLASDVLGGTADPAGALLPPSLLAEQSTCGHCRQDPELARALFAAWSDAQPTGSPPLRLTLTYPREGGHVAIAEAIARDLESVLDVRAILQARDLGGFGRAVIAGEAPLFRLGMVASLAGDAAVSSLLDPRFRTSGTSEQNWTRWADAGTDRLLDALRATGDPQAAARIAAVLVEEAVVVPLLWTRHDLVVRPEVEGFVLDSTGRWWPELVALR